MSWASPTSLAEAIRCLGESPDLRPIAGGTDLMVRDAVERHELGPVLDLTRVPELGVIQATDSGLEIGAAVTFSRIRGHARTREAFPSLVAAAAEVGGWQIQNRATLGGNIANASPAGDSLPVLLALGARLVCAGPDGSREVPYDDFHPGYRRTVLGAAELIVRIRLPWPAPEAVQGFRKVGTREAQAISKVVVAGYAVREGEGWGQVRLAAGSVAATPVRLRGAEAALRDGPLSGAASRAGRAAREETEPIDDVRSTAVYRSHVLERVVRRMVAGWIAGGRASR